MEHIRLHELERDILTCLYRRNMDCEWLAETLDYEVEEVQAALENLELHSFITTYYGLDGRWESQILYCAITSIGERYVEARGLNE